MHFLTAAELEISSAEREALIAVLHGLQGPSIVHAPDDDEMLMAVSASYRVSETMPEQVIGFNMSMGAGVFAEDQSHTHNCGSAACIGGHMSLHMQGFDTALPQRYPAWALVKAQSYVEGFTHRSESPLQVLFMPPATVTVRWDTITPEQASVAIEYFLRTGKPTEAWNMALSSPQA